MILSHLHKFVFIKGHKVASTSIEIALSQICGPDDIITPITPVDERQRLAGGGIARNYSDDPAAEQAYADAIANKPIDQVGEIPRDVRFNNHMNLRKLRRVVPGTENYRVIFAERSPYEKVLSLANWRRGLRTYTSGGELSQSTDGLVEKVWQLIRRGSIMTCLNIELYKDDDGAIHGDCWRFETIADDLATFLADLGVPPIALPHAKAGLGLKASEVKDLLEPDQIAYINDAFVEEFDTFGYPRVT